MAPCEDQRDDILLGREGVVKMAVLSAKGWWCIASSIHELLPGAVSRVSEPLHTAEMQKYDPLCQK